MKKNITKVRVVTKFFVIDDEDECGKCINVRR